MQPICCINLCEYGASLDGAAVKKNPRILNDFISACCTEAAFPVCERLYVGSNFCVNAFMHLDADLFDVLDGFCRIYDVPVTLVLPIVTERNTEKFKAHLDELLARADSPIDELTVNDFGMLSYASAHFDIPLNLGRLFNKDLRDPRYPETFRVTAVPALLTGGLERICADYPKVGGIELDPMADVVDFSALPDNVSAGIHFPLCYLTTGHLCEVAAQGRQYTSKFHSEAPCNDECLHTDVHYMLEYTGDDEGEPPCMTMIKHGKTVYYPNPTVRVVGTENYRLIYTPDRFGWTAKDNISFDRKLKHGRDGASYVISTGSRGKGRR